MGALNPFDDVMKTVRDNLHLLHARLITAGYRFHKPTAALVGPDPDVEEHIAFIESKIGLIPKALTAFYRIVGSVDFVGRHPEWSGCQYPDPIQVDAIAYVVREAREYCELDSPPEQYWASDSGVFRIPVGADYYHKANESGGMWYGIEVPNEQDDPLLLEEWHGTTFVEYLRICCRWGGFPGLERVASRHTWPVERLTEGLWEF